MLVYSNIKVLEKDDLLFAGNHTSSCTLHYKSSICSKFRNYGRLRRSEGPNCVIISYAQIVMVGIPGFRLIVSVCMSFLFSVVVSFFFVFILTGQLGATCSLSGSLAFLVK